MSAPNRLPSVVGLLLGLAAAGIGVRLGWFAQGLPLLSWGLVAIALVAALFGAGWKRLGETRLGAIDIAFIAYAGIRLSLELVNAAELRHAVSPQVFVDLLVEYVAFFSARLVVRSPEDLSRFVRSLALPVLVVAPLAIAQILRVPGVGEWIVQNTAAAGFERRFTLGYEIRGTATLGHHTQLGGYLVALVAAICTDLLISRRLRRPVLLPALLLGFAVIAQITTLTFATVGATGVVIVVTLIAMGLRPAPILLLAGAGAVGWSLFGASFEQRIENQSVQRSQEFSWLPETIAYRMGIWINETWPAIIERPLLGWGYDVYASYEKGWPVRPASLVWGSPESEYFRVLITGGFVSLAFEITLILAVLVGLVRVSRQYRSEKYVLPVLTALVALLVISGIHNHFSSYGAPLVLWPLVGAVLGIGAAKQAGGRPRQALGESGAKRFLEAR